MKRMTYRNLQNTLLFFTILVLVFAFYSEYVQKLQPCPLCLMQRFCAFLFGFLCLAALGLRTLHRARIIAMVQVIVACLGVYFAARQLWLQSLPPNEAQLCMPGLDALVNYFSLGVILKTFFWGSHECAEVTWRWLGLSMPAWAAIYFGLMAAANIALAILLSITIKNNAEPPRFDKPI